MSLSRRGEGPSPRASYTPPVSPWRNPGRARARRVTREGTRARPGPSLPFCLRTRPGAPPRHPETMVKCCWSRWASPLVGQGLGAPHLRVGPRDCSRGRAFLLHSCSIAIGGDGGEPMARGAGPGSCPRGPEPSTVGTPILSHTDLACNTSYHFAASCTVFPRVPPYLARDRLRLLAHVYDNVASIHMTKNPG